MYEVFALKYGERDTTKCQFFYRESSHDKLTLDYVVWLILGGPQPLLCDTGCRDDAARAGGIRNYVSPAAMVERAGVKPGDIPISLITHLHYDHWAGHSLFPNAEFWIQGEEVAFWTGPFGRLPAFRGSANVEALAHLTTLNYGNKIRIIEGDHEVWPGLRVHRVGGHTAGLQIVSIETRRGTVVLTSDASHFYHNVETRPAGQFVMGHEYAGTVAALGTGVDEFRVGDRVAVEVHKGCDRCENCIKGWYTSCLNYGDVSKGHRAKGLTCDGGFAEFAVNHINTLYRLPANLSFEQACMVTTAASPLWAIDLMGGYVAGETVLVQGPGPIGLIAVQLCKALGAARVILTGTRDTRLAIGERLGADFTINVRKENLAERVREITDGRGADCVLECAGGPTSMQEALENVKRS